MSVSSFSQTTSLSIDNTDVNIRVIKEDSTGITLIAFDSSQINQIIRDLKEIGWNKKEIKTLEMQVNSLKYLNNKHKQKADTLEKKVEKYVEITINHENIISLKEKEIIKLEENIEDYKVLDTNNEKIKEEYLNTIKTLRKRMIILIGTNVLTFAILVLIIL